MSKEKPVKPSLPSLTITPDKAIFWMDGQGRWHNRHGPFEHKRIIDHFNASIDKDDDGYFVTQENNGVREKVYFVYEDTALFVVDVVLTDPAKLLLNTAAQIDFQADALTISEDQLYIHWGPHRIKFAQRALLKISRMMEYRDQIYYIRLNEQLYPIGEEKRLNTGRGP
jgi:hypothetical protein